MRTNEDMNTNLSSFTDVLGDEIPDSLPLSLSSNMESQPRIDLSGNTNRSRPAKGTGQVGNFRSVEEVDSKYRDVFTYQYFNLVQSGVLDDGLYTDKSMVVCAPTGSGKTVIFEMAIVQLLMDMESKQCNDDFKIIYMAPVKALCTERLTEWYSKFTKLGLLCIEVTGDTNVDLSQLKPYKIIITTPEKWDMMTRRWRDHRGLVEIVKLFLIDEVHILNDEVRGPVLEAVVSRMKTIESAAQSAHRIEKLQKQYQSNADGELTSPHSKSTAPPRIRFVAVSATVSNPQDVAAWLGNENQSAVYYKFGDECRPVKIKRVVEGYPCPDGTSIFKFDIILNYKLWPVIQKYHDGKPTLIFCNTRKSVQMTAEALSREITITFNAEQRAKLTALASTIKTKKLQSLVLSGVGCHHAGMLYEERLNIEHAFRDRELPILITTTTLAMGVNLPAHLVIIKNTQQYVNGTFQEYGISMVLQMLGRAGRPQFDTDATAVIMTRQRDKARYQALVEGTEPLQSYLHKRLAENLNSEAALGTVGDVAQCVQWLRSTFLYVRAAKDPKRYLSLPPAAPSYQISKKIEEMCVRAMNGLASAGLITMDEASCIASTEAGRLMSVYYLDLETMKLLMKIQGGESLERLLGILCECHELADMHLRVDERRSLNALNRNNTAATIRFPMKGKINSRQMKVNCIIQAVLGCLPIPDPSLNQEAMKIMRIAARICKCLVAYVTRPEIKTEEQTYFSAILNSIILCKCMEAGLWETSSYVSKQLKGIGPTYSTLLATAGKVNFMLLEESHPRDLERIMNKGPPAGNVLRKQIGLLPKYQIEATPVNEKTVSVQLLLLNHAHLSENVDQLTAGEAHRCYVIAGDSKNYVLLLNTFKDKDLISVYNGTMTYEITRRHNFEHKVYIHCISSTFVGIDAHCEYTFKNLMPSVPNDINSSSAYFTDTETPKRQESKSACPKKRKSNCKDDITQSKEKKKRENALAEKFRLLKESFSKTSDNMKNSLQEVDKMSKCALNDLFQIDNSNLVKNMNTCVAEKDSNPEIFDKICELENDGICDDFDDIMDNEKIDSILNNIENEILINNKDTVASTCQNDISKEIGNRVETSTTRNSRKNKLARTESNYKFIELLERNVDLNEEDEIPNNDNGFSETIKSRLDKYLDNVRVKEDVASDPIIKELCREPGFKPEQSNEKDDVSIHKNLSQSRLSCIFDDKDIKLYKRPQKFDEINNTRTANSNTFLENNITESSAFNKLSSEQSNQLVVSNEKGNLSLNENNRESHFCHEIGDIENDMFEYPQKIDNINYSTTTDIKSDKMETTTTSKDLCIVSNQNRVVRKYQNDPQSRICFKLDSVDIDVYKPFKEYDNIPNTEIRNIDVCFKNGENKTMNAMLKDIYRSQDTTQLGMQENIPQLCFYEKKNNENTDIQEYKSPQYLNSKDKAIVADANIKNSKNVNTAKPFTTAIAKRNLSIGLMISEQESSKPITIQISQNFGEPLKENRNYSENLKSFNQQNSLMLHPHTGNALQIVSTDTLKCDNIIQNNDDTIKDINQRKYDGDKAIQNNETNLIIVKQKQSNSFASSNQNSFESTNSQLRQENYNSLKNSITPEIASFGENDITTFYSKKIKDDEYYPENQSAKHQFPEPYLSSQRNKSDNEYSSADAQSSKSHEVKYAFSAEKVDVQSTFTNEHQIRYIRRLKVDLDVTEIILEEKNANPFNIANSTNKEDLSNVVEGDTLKHHSLKIINRLEKTTLTKDIDSNKKAVLKENADDQGINRAFPKQSKNKDETLSIHHNDGYNNNFKNNNNIENILQKYSKKLSKDGKCVKTPIIQNTYKDNCKNQKFIKSNKPFKITDIQNLNIPLPNLCDSPKITYNLGVRGQMASKVTERNATSDSSFIVNPDGEILTENPNCYKDIHNEKGCSEYNLTPLPLNIADNLAQQEINIDHSMLDPKALLKCFENDESNNEELIPPPPEFCDQRGVYSPELSDDLDTDLFTHENYQEDPRFNNDNAPYINTFNIVKDNIDKINMLPPAEETETWTLSQNDVEIDSFSQNPVPPYTTFYRMNLQNNTNQLISNPVPAYIPREKNLNQFKYIRKNKPKIKL